MPKTTPAAAAETGDSDFPGVKTRLGAYAYARAAELTAARNQLILEELDYWKKASSRNLSEDQLAEAEKLALELQSLNEN